jgi:signal transduction histidine kinase
MLQRAQAAARHLRELVNDVLDLSKVESGKIDVADEDVILHQLITEVVATIDPLAQEYSAPIRCDLDESLTVRTDPRRVRQIMLNLLSNAVKFGAGRPVVVRSGVLEPASVFVEVRDRGPGIAPDQIERIFEEFVQLESIRQGGTGLGLSISRRLAIALGGSLAAASSPGLGSTFTLTLPQHR